jgi:hypothetical protein
MTMPAPRRVTRRTLLKMAVAGGWSLGAVLLIPTQSTAAVSSSRRPGALRRTAVEDASSLPRYRFDCITPVPAFAPLGRLEEVWASSRYMTFTGCVVSYVGLGYFRLTPEESQIVDAVADAGGDVSDREATFLRVLTASTRVDPSRLEEKLAEFGRPIIAGSLALAPDAPQAKLFAKWLDAGA